MPRKLKLTRAAGTKIVTRALIHFRKARAVTARTRLGEMIYKPAEVLVFHRAIHVHIKKAGFTIHKKTLAFAPRTTVGQFAEKLVAMSLPGSVVTPIADKKKGKGKVV